MEITIREYQSTDEGQLLEILRVNNTYFENIDSWHALQFPEGAEKFYLDQMVQGSKTGKFFIAQVDHRIVGFIQGQLHVQTESEIMERGKSISGDISEFFVLEEFRRSGIGTKLIASIENYFKDQGCTGVALNVFAPNELARNFYAKYGFVERALILVKRMPTNSSSVK